MLSNANPPGISILVEIPSSAGSRVCLKLPDALSRLKNGR
jgi:hypothetical protein